MEINLLESVIKVREGKKWKSRWCILKKASPVADCLHLHIYKDTTGSKKQPKEKATYVLEDFCGVESGYRVDKEQHVLAILCVKQVLLLAFHHRLNLQQWTLFIRDKLTHETTFQATLIQSPSEAKLQQRPVRIFVTSQRLSLVAHIPPVILVTWLLSDIRRFGVVASETFCVEGGSRAGKGNGLFVFLTDHGHEIETLLRRTSTSAQQTAQSLTHRQTHTGCIAASISPIELAQSRHSVLLTTPSPSPLASQSPVFTFPSPSSKQLSQPVGPDWHPSHLSHHSIADWHPSQHGTTQDGHTSQLSQHSIAADWHPSQLSPAFSPSNPTQQDSGQSSRARLLQERSHLFSSFGDLGVNSEVKRCIESRQDRRTRCGSADLLDRRCSKSSLDYVNTNATYPGAAENDRVLDGSLTNHGISTTFSPSRRVTANNLPIIHGHSRSVGCDGSENYMDFSNILKDKAKGSRRKQQQSVSASSSAYTSETKLDKVPLSPSIPQYSTNSGSITSHSHTNEVFTNQVPHGSQDLLSEILTECKLRDSSQFHNSPLGEATGESGSINHDVGGNRESQVSHQSIASHITQTRVAPPLITRLQKPSVKEHSYVNYQPSQNHKTNVNQKQFDQKAFPFLHNLLKGTTHSTIEPKSESVTSETKKVGEGHVTGCLSNETTTAEHDSNKTVDTDNEKKFVRGVCRYTERCSTSLPDLLDSDYMFRDQDGDLDCQRNSIINDMAQRGGEEGTSDKKGSSQKMKKSHQQKKRQSRSLPEFDPLRPLEFVDLSRYDGKDEGYLYWLKAGGSNPETRSSVASTSQGYDNIEGMETTESSYMNVDMQCLKQSGGKAAPPAVGYDNVPASQRPSGGGGDKLRNYDNLVGGDNRTDYAKSSVEYENFPASKAQTVASSNYYQNIPHNNKCAMPNTGANTYSSSSSNSKKAICDVSNKDFYANIPPEPEVATSNSPTKSKAGKKKSTKEKKGSYLPFGGTFAIHGSLRRNKKEAASAATTSISNSSSEAGDIAGAYVQLKGSSVEGDHVNTMGVTNLAHHTMTTARFEGMSDNGVVVVNEDNVELVILDMSDDDPQRDNIANMLVEQGRPLPRGRPLYGRTGPPQPLPPRRFSIHTVNPSNFSSSHSPELQRSSHHHQQPSPGKEALGKRSAFQPVDKNKPAISKTRSASPLILLEGQQPEGDTYGAFKKDQKTSKLNTPEKRGRDCEYIDMSQPLRPLPDDLLMQQHQQQLLPAHTLPMVHASRSRNNSSSSSTMSQASSQDQHPRDSPYMDMSFMKHKHTKSNKSPLATPERKKTMASPKSSPLLHAADRLCLAHQENGCVSVNHHRRLQHSKSLDNDLDDMYYGSESNGPLTAVNGTAAETGDGSGVGKNFQQQYVPMSTITRHIHHQTETNQMEATNGGGDSKLIRRSHSENDGEKPLKPFDGLLDLPCYTEQQQQKNLSSKKLAESSTTLASGGCGHKGSNSMEEDNVSTASSGSSSGTMSRRGSKGFLARLMRKNSSAKDLAKISKSQEDIPEVESEAARTAPALLTTTSDPEPPPPELYPRVVSGGVGGATEHIYAQIPEQMPEMNGTTSSLEQQPLLRDPVTLPLRKKTFRSETSETSYLLDPVVRKEMTLLPHTTAAGRVCLEHGNLTDEQKQSCASLMLSGGGSGSGGMRSMTPPTPPPNIPLPPPPRKVKESLSSTPPAPPVPLQTYKRGKKIPPPLLQPHKAEHEYVDIDDEDFTRGTGRETPSNKGLQPFQQGGTVAENFSHLGFLADGRPVPPPRPVSTLGPSSKSLCYEMEDCCDRAAKPRQVVQRSVSLRANNPTISQSGHFRGGASTLPPHNGHPHQATFSVDTTATNTTINRYVLGPSTTTTALTRPRSSRGVEYHHQMSHDKKRWLGGDDCPSSSGQSSGSQTPASSSQSSPTKSPGSLHQPNVFNFDLQKVQQRRTGSDTDSPRSPGGGSRQLGFRDPDHVYMNLTFPKSPGGGRSGSPVVVVEQHHRSAVGGNIGDYANVVLNYAEIDLSHKNKDSSSGGNGSGRRRPEKPPQKESNIDYAMIDMVATAAVSRAGKEHIRHREEESLRHHRRQLRRNEQTLGGEASGGNTKENHRKSHKERKSGGHVMLGGATGNTSSSGGTTTKDKKLGRSNSSISRSSANSVDRKSSLPA